jgi:TusA-related sulfurtransferase
MAEQCPARSEDAELDAIGATCATLTPLIRTSMRELKSGGVLVVRTDDPTAREGISAWSRLTGNDLVAVEDEADHTRYYLRKK